MASDTIQIEISRNIMNELFTSVGLEMPENIDDEEIIKLIKAIKIISEAISSKGIEVSTIKDDKAKSILVVDDLGLVVYQLSLLLTKNGYNVMLARSAPEAFTLFEERGPFDFVLTDLFMPNKDDGLSLVSKLKTLIGEKTLSTKVIVMSATKDLNVIEEVMKLGADSFLEKGQNWKSDLIEILKKIAVQ